jgi:LPS sulfotransferase NodH
MAAFEKPIFIVSSPRSGSTLLRLILDAHPNIAIPSPAWIYEYILPFLYSYGDLTDEANFREMVQDMIEMPTIKEWMVDFTVDEVVEKCPNRSFKEAYDYLHVKDAEAKGKIRWGEKSPRNGYWIEEIKADFPDAQFIHIIRDGRDMAIDISQSQSMRPCSVLMGAHFWKHYVSGITKDIAKLDAADRYTIKYESMCADPETELKKLCDYLGEDFDPAMLRHSETPSTKKWASIGNHVATGAPISTKYCEMYKTRLKGIDAQVLESVIGDLLQQYGYPVSGDPKTLPPRLEAQIMEGDMISAPNNDRYRTELENKRLARKERGVYSDDDRESLLRSLF